MWRPASPAISVQRSFTKHASVICRSGSTSLPSCWGRTSTRRPESPAWKRPRARAWSAPSPTSAGAGYTSMAGSAFDQRPKTQYFQVFEYFDSLTWVKGRHILKFGGQIRHWKPLFTDSQQYQGTWNFTGIMTQNPAKTAGTGDGFADFMLGYPASASRGFPGNWFGGYATFWHFFVQDDFKVGSRLTLNIGLRYEYSPWLNGYRG